MVKIAQLTDRGILELTGADRIQFLQGLVSNDVTAASPGRAVWAAMLTPQGKWLADFFIFADADRLLLDCELAQLPDLATRLSRFRLRAQVAVRDLSATYEIYAAWDTDAGASAASAPFDKVHIQAADPRLPQAGFRAAATTEIVTNASQQDWNAHRIGLGLPNGSQDLEAEKTVLLEAGFDELSGVSWTKGCYLGQELTARTKYRGLVKKRLVPVTMDGPPPPAGSTILQEGRDVGVLRSTGEHNSLAMIRLDALNQRLTCDSRIVKPILPYWFNVSGPNLFQHDQ